jgi:hypothetical protein
MGMASWRAGELSKEDKAAFHFTNSLEFLCKSHELGIAQKRPEEWQDPLCVCTCGIVLFLECSFIFQIYLFSNIFLE